MLRSRKIRIFTTVFSCLLIGHFLFVACNQITDDIEEKKEASLASSPSDTSQPQDTPTIPPTSKPSLPTNNPPSTTDSSTSATATSTSSTDSSTPSTGNPLTSADSSTPSAGNPQTSADSSTPSNTDWSDYQYYKNLVISKEASQVRAITRYFPEEDEDKIVYLLKELRDTIIPQAVTSLLNRFPKTFAHLKEQEIGMGIFFMNDSGKPSVAAFEAILANEEATQYGLTVNYGNFSWESGALSSNSRNELEAYIVHEMMHALISEALTCGYFGCDSTMQVNKSKQFPLWFQEGIAETTCGSARNLRNHLKKQYLLSVINGTEVLTSEEEEQMVITTDEMEAFIKNNPLNPTSSNKFVATYQIGWLATMYLGYLTNGGTDISPQAIANGLDTLMSEIYSGKTLSQVIQNISYSKYSSLEDFETKFTGENTDVLQFTVDLMNAIGSGRGSVLINTYKDFSSIPNDSDLLSDDSVTNSSKLFWLYIGANNLYTNKIYGDNYPLFEGGFAR